MQLAKFWIVAVASLLLSGCAGINKPTGFALPFTAASAAKQPADAEVVAQQQPVTQAAAQQPWNQNIRNTTNDALSVANGLASSMTNRYDAAKGQGLFQTAERTFASASAAQGSDRIRQFEKAADQYEAASKAFPPSPNQENAIFMAAESNFFADRYLKAGDYYENLLKNYPSTRHIDTVDQRRYAIAKYWLDVHESDNDRLPNFGDKRRPAIATLNHSVKMFDEIRFDNPTGEIADDATMAAAIATLKNGRFGESDVLLEDIRENFPSSKHQFQAHLLSLECKQKVYRGPDYDGTALDDAENLIRQMHIRFPAEVAQNQAYIQESLKEIRLMKAQYHFNEAQYYDRRKEYGAARMGYELVAREFSDTNLAVEAESRLAQIGGRPANPTSRLDWLAKLFPEENTRPRPLLARDDGGRRVR